MRGQVKSNINRVICILLNGPASTPTLIQDTKGRSESTQPSVTPVQGQSQESSPKDFCSCQTVFKSLLIKTWRLNVVKAEEKSEHLRKV